MRIIQEGTGGTNFGTYNAGASGGQILFPTLYGGNPFSMRIVPARQVIRTADAGNRRKQVVSARKVVAGTLNTLLHPDQAAYWMTAATSLSSNYLPSYSIEYWDSVRALRFLGCTVRSLKISSSAQQDYVTMTVDFLGQVKDGTFSSFSQPAESNYSTLVPYEHFESASNITLGGTAITKYQSTELTISNVLAGTWDEQTYITACYYCGRDLDFTVGPQYLATAYRGDFEAQTALTWVWDFTRASPSHGLSFNCETNSYVSNIDDQLPLDGPGYQSVSVQVFYDPANTTDFAITVS